MIIIITVYVCVVNVSGCCGDVMFVRGRACSFHPCFNPLCKSGRGRDFARTGLRTAAMVKLSGADSLTLRLLSARDTCKWQVRAVSCFSPLPFFPKRMSSFCAISPLVGRGRARRIVFQTPLTSAPSAHCCNDLPGPITNHFITTSARTLSTATHANKHGVRLGRWH